MRFVTGSITTLLCAALFYGSFASAACSTGAEADYLKRTQDLFNSGDNTTYTDVAMAELGYLQARLVCHEIGLAGYCTKAPDLAKTIVAGTFEEVRVGHRSHRDVFAALKEQREVQKACESPFASRL